MPFPTTNATKELPAINQILSSCGQAPVTTLDTTNPDVAIAYDTLLQVNREIQAEGWTFNREPHYEFIPNDSDEVEIPNNILQIKLSQNGTNAQYDGIRRSGKLYDRLHHRYTMNVREYIIALVLMCMKVIRMFIEMIGNYLRMYDHSCMMN